MADSVLTILDSTEVGRSTDRPGFSAHQTRHDKFSVESTIVSTDSAIKGQTASSSYKPATLENGINLMVPPFINPGDKIILDTRTLEYMKKLK